MRSIERRFKNNQAKRRGWSSVVCFATAISGQGFSADRLSRHFNDLVDANDYDKSDKRAILGFLADLNSARGVLNLPPKRP